MEKIRNILLKLSTNVSKIIFLIIVVLLCISSMILSCGFKKEETTKYMYDNIFVNIFASILFVCVLWLIKKSKKIKTGKVIIWAIAIIWILLAVGWIQITKFTPNADQEYIMNAAKKMTINKFGSFVGKGYINQNPQQRGMVLLEYIIALINKKNLIIVFQLLNVVMLFISFLAMYKTTQIMFDDKKISKITIVMLFLFLPIFFYITFMYGNIIGFAFSNIAIWLEMEYKKKNKWYTLLGSGICIAIAIILKSNFLIILIAMIIMYFLDMLENKKLKNLLSIVTITVIYLIMSFFTKFTIENITNTKSSKGIPMISYVAMGMQEGSRAPGWFNEYNRKVYKKSGYDYDEASRRSKLEIENRINVFKNDIPYAIDFYLKKIASQWINPTFQGFWVNKERDSLNEERVKIKVKSTNSKRKKSYIVKFNPYKNILNEVLEDGTVNKVLTKYMDIMQSIILLGASLYIILDYKNVDGNKLFYIIIFIGGFIFHIIWEAKCQYTITYFILLIPYCVKGYDLLLDKKIFHKYDNLEQNQM